MQSAQKSRQVSPSITPDAAAATSHGGPIVDQRNGYEIIACEACGFRHAMPLPDEAALQAEYAESYYRDEKPEYLQHAAEDAAWLKLMHQDRLEIIKAEILDLPGPHSLLDIGSGPGFFLDAARELGFQTRGVEPSRQAAAFARERGHNIINAMFDDATAAAIAPVDVITLTNVLEHVADPIALLRRASARLKPRGVLMVAVPNDYSPLQIAARDGLGADPWWIAPPHHLNYFDFDTLGDLVSRLGLETFAQTTNFPMELFLLMGENYIGNQTLGRACHVKRKNVDLALERAGLGHVRKRLYGALAQGGFGREAVNFSRKPVEPA